MNFESAFKYTSIAKHDSDYDNYNDDLTDKSKNATSFIHHFIVVIFYFSFIITFPLTIWFCIKKVNSLQRCVVFRLGKRLPLKGPGLVIIFPCIDAFEIVDLSDHQITIADSEQDLLTGDGSIIKFTEFTGKLHVMNAVKSSTQLKDAKFNASQFAKLSFINMIGSTHIEDIEKKTDIVMRQFQENCNLYLNNWGWEININHFPKFTVMDRSDPLKPLLSKLKGLFNSDVDIASPPPSSSTTSGPNLFANLMKMHAPVFESFIVDNSPKFVSSAPLLITPDDGPSDLQLLSALQSMADKYSHIITYDIFIAIEIKVISWNEYFKFIHKTGEVIKVNERPPKVHINVTAKTPHDLMDFCQTNDTTRVEITTNLL